MKIAIDISQIAYTGSGVASYTENLVRRLLQTDRNNQYLLFGISLRQIDALTNFTSELKTKYSNVESKIIRLPQTLGNIVWNRYHVFDLGRFIGNADIFHSSDWIQPPIKGVNKVTTIHDLVVYKYPQISHPDIVATQKRRLYWVKRECDAIIADSVSTKRDILETLNVEPDKVIVVYPGIDRQFIPQDEEEFIRVRQKYNLPERYILFVGTREPRKNLQRLILAFDRFLRHPLVSSQNKEINLVLVGRTGWGQKLKNVRFVYPLGMVEKKDLPAIYSGAVFFVFPSLYEGFGLPILEAMACGCPVVTSNMGSLAEIASDCALQIDPYDEEDISVKMVQLFIDQNLRKEIIKKGFSQAEKFKWEDAASKILKIYESLIS